MPNKGATMPYMFGRVTVEDYETFCDVFDDAKKLRHSAGSTGDTFYQSADNPNDVTVQVEFQTIDAAKAYALSQGLREAMKRAGVQGSPTIWFVNEA